ncbi:unnamed protein product [Linum trigynum]|uniref:Uncharacterized protein n=1 Tax=Linum trigynum TaxID=586398 RepID=A0AAV2FFY3_9ROSI
MGFRDLKTFNLAMMGYRPSYIWKSIMKAKEMIIDGFRWKVGNGNSIRIWEDEWIPGKSFFYPDPLPANELPKDLVSSIIDQHKGIWDSKKIRSLFSVQDQSLITKIPLSSPPKEDSWVWKDSDFGSYTVRSAYFWIRNKQQSKIARFHSIDEDDSEFWKNLWNLDTQPKVKNLPMENL